MMKKHHKPEEIVTKLRQADVLNLARTIGCGRRAGDRVTEVTNTNLR